jgi:hypothetical protein
MRIISLAGRKKLLKPREVVPEKAGEWECDPIFSSRHPADAMVTFKGIIAKFAKMAVGPSAVGMLARSLAQQEAAWYGPAADVELLELNWLEALEDAPEEN